MLRLCEDLHLHSNSHALQLHLPLQIHLQKYEKLDQEVKRRCEKKLNDLEIVRMGEVCSCGTLIEWNIGRI